MDGWFDLHHFPWVRTDISEEKMSTNSVERVGCGLTKIGIKYIFYLSSIFKQMDLIFN